MKKNFLLLAMCSAFLFGTSTNASADIVIANLAADYVSCRGYWSCQRAMSYLFSSAATGGTEVALTPNVTVGGDGQVGFGSEGPFGVAAIDGTNDNGGDFELFNNSNSLGGASGANNHDAVVGEDLLFHPGQDVATQQYVIARYTVSADDLVGTTGIASLTSSFQSFNDGGQDTGTDFEVYLNGGILGTAIDGATVGTGNDVASFAIAAGDEISFVVGSNGNFGGGETAVQGIIRRAGSRSRAILIGDPCFRCVRLCRSSPTLGFRLSNLFCQPKVRRLFAKSSP